MNAGRGYRPSWGWQSLIMGRDAISHRIMWVVGNGKKISIRNDKWLKKGSLGGPATRNEPLKVADLLDIEEGKWNEPLLKTI